MPLIKHLLKEYTGAQKNDILKSNEFTISLEIEANYPEMDENTIINTLMYNIETSLNEIYKSNKNINWLSVILELDDLKEYFEDDYEFDTVQDIQKNIPQKEIYNRIEAWLNDLYLDYETLELFEEHDLFRVGDIRELTEDYIFYDGRLSELEKLPNIEFDKDGDYTLEIRNEQFFNSIDEAIKFYEIVTGYITWEGIFMMDEWTSAHINMGMKNSRKYNILKMMILANEGYAKSKLRDSDFSNKELLPELNSDIKAIVKKNISQGDNISITKKVFKDFLNEIYKEDYQESFLDYLRSGYEKKLGINITKLVQFHGIPYIEFRYPSSDESSETIKDKMAYYGHLTKLCFDPEYMKHEYWRRLFKHIYKIVEEQREQSNKN